MSTFPWHFQQGEKHCFAIFNKLLIFSCYSVLFGFYIFVMTRDLGDEGRTRLEENRKKLHYWDFLWEASLADWSWIPAAVNWLLDVVGAPEKLHPWKVPRGKNLSGQCLQLTGSCEQHPRVMGFTLIFPFFSRMSGHQESLQGLTHLFLLIRVTEP